MGFIIIKTSPHWRQFRVVRSISITFIIIGRESLLAFGKTRKDKNFFMSSVENYHCVTHITAILYIEFMTDSNLNFWGEISVPVGVAICFGVALAYWLVAELRAEKEDPDR